MMNKILAVMLLSGSLSLTNTVLAGYPTSYCVAESHYCMAANIQHPDTLKFTSYQHFMWFSGTGGSKKSIMKLNNSGELLATSFNRWSDESLKENIEDLNNPLSLITSLRGVTYQFKDRKSRKSNIGLIAQEVEKIVPEIVNTEKNGLKSIDYTALIPLLIESVKIQQKTIEVLKKELSEVKIAQNKNKISEISLLTH